MQLYNGFPVINLFLNLLIGLLTGLATQAQTSEVVVNFPTGERVKLYTASYALVIGNSKYTNGWPVLPGVKKDVDLVSSELRQKGFQVKVEYDLDKAGMDRAFSEFINLHGNQAEHRLLFYFAGHGHSVKTSYGDQLGFIVPVDAPNPNVDPAGFKGKSMEMQQIEIYSKRIESKHALFLFDACFSGSLFSLSRAVPEIISYKTQQPVRQYITSGSADETVPDESIFRDQFIRALRGEADVNRDGYLTGTELGEFLQGTVTNYSRNSQHPQYGKIRNPNLDKGDFVFLVNPALTYAPPATTAIAPTPADAPQPQALSSSAPNPLNQSRESVAEPTTTSTVASSSTTSYSSGTPTTQSTTSTSTSYTASPPTPAPTPVADNPFDPNHPEYNTFPGAIIEYTSTAQNPALKQNIFITGILSYKNGRFKDKSTTNSTFEVMGKKQNMSFVLIQLANQNGSYTITTSKAGTQANKNLTYENLPTMIERTNLRIEYKEDTMEILGFMCKSAEISFVTHGYSATHRIWYTADIKLPIPFNSPAYNVPGIGFPLRYETLGGTHPGAQFKTTWEVTSFRKQTLTDTEFDLPPGISVIE